MLSLRHKCLHRRAHCHDGIYLQTLQQAASWCFPESADTTQASNDEEASYKHVSDICRVPKDLAFLTAEDAISHRAGAEADVMQVWTVTRVPNSANELCVQCPQVIVGSV